MKGFPKLIVSLLITTTCAFELTSNTHDEITVTTSHLRRLFTRFSDPRIMMRKITETFSAEKLDMFNPNYDFFVNIHKSEYPAKAAGEWVYREDLATRPSEEHLQCFRKERQGNCHAPMQSENPTKSEKMRQKLVEKDMIANSPGILDAKDPWVWESDLDKYKIVFESNPDKYRERVRKIMSGRTIHLIGDSLTRQWHRQIMCEFMHIHGMSEEDADKHVKFYKTFGPPVDEPDYGFRPDNNPDGFKKASKKDIVVINLGHHFGFREFGDDWQEVYDKAIQKIFTLDFGKIPDENIFFRTTSVRYFINGSGDFNTENFKVGKPQLDMKAQWKTYGGSLGQNQPTQNFIALDVLKNKIKRKIQIFDTAPMSLARCDASFDGSHFCFPGPIEYWTKMLFYQIELRKHHKEDVDM